MPISRRKLGFAVAATIANGLSLGAAPVSGQTPVSLGTPSIPGSLKWKFPTSESVDILHMTNGVIISVGRETTQAIDASSGSGLWKHSVGTHPTYYSALAADGVLFLSEEESAVAFDATNGEEMWRVSSSAPAILLAEGLLCLQEHIPDPIVKAVDSASGSELWRSESNNIILGITENVMIIIENYSIIVGIELRTWNELWRFDTGSLIRGHFLLDLDKVIIVSNDIEILVFAASNGQQLLRKTLIGDISELTISENILIAGDDDGITGLDLASGNELWRFAANTQYIEELAVSNGVLYLSIYNGDTTTTLYAVNVSNGSEVWNIYIERDEIMGLTVHAGSIYAPFYDAVFVFDAESGSQRWQFDTEDQIRTPVLIFQDTAYFGCIDSNVYAVVAEPERSPSAKSGSAATTLVETPVRASPLQSGDVVTSLSAGTEVFVSGGSQETGGITWWPIIAPDGTEGWVDGSMLSGQP